MLKAIILPGSSVKNKAWAEQISSELSGLFDIQTQYYRHWGDGGDETDLDYETDQLVKLIGSREDGVILAKSVGTLITLNTIAKRGLKPRAIIFFGLPLKLVEKISFPLIDYLSKINAPLLIFQNEFDPWGSFSEVSDLVKPKENACVHCFSSVDTHDYLDFGVIKGEINRFIKNF